MTNAKTDQQLKSDVESELAWQPAVTAAHIGVSVNEGIVTLSGHVPTYAEKYSAEKATKRVFGIKAVANELDVKLPNGGKRTDQDIATSCVHALRENLMVPDDKITLVVDSGFVTLDGEVQWQFQRDAAENAIRYLSGVRGMLNNIKLKSHVAANDVKHAIEAALKRSAEVDSKKITVETKNGKVILHGNVRSWAERDEAQQAAWAAPGVTAVENDLSIAP